MKKGFTFIEILVVVTIIGLLTTVATVSYRSANRKARDNKRKSDIEQVRAALEMYRADNSQYPSGPWSGMIASIESYLNEGPQDPRPSDFSYFYNRGATKTEYHICAHFEADADVYIDGCGGATLYKCGAEVNCNYRVDNP